jgi:hypothetical protein
MWSKALVLAAALVFCAGQTATSAPVLEHDSGRATGSHFVGDHFGHHQHFGHHRGKVLIIPYPVDGPYFDYGEAPTDEIPLTNPPSMSSAPAANEATACHRSVQTFTVPSAEGGTSEITIMRC